jgi:hypothetical protein
MSSVRFDQTAADVAEVTPLVDEAIERYVNWREECGAVKATYECWSRAPREERIISFATCIAALDREECAARAYASAIQRLSSVVAGRQSPAL